jgi:hypothetical protein
MNAIDMFTDATHTFTLSGLGDAPFKIVQPGVHSVDAGHVFWCEHCGTQIKNRNFVKSACGKVSVVGIDCLKKTGDAGLIDGAKRLKTEQRFADQESQRMARVAERQDAQRVVNGGKTDAEVIDKLNAKLERISTEYRETTTEHPVLKSLGDSMFEQDMSHYFYLLKPFSIGQLCILKEIMTKKTTGARKNSKAYKTGFEAAAAEVDKAQEKLTIIHAELEIIRQEILVWRQK